MSYSILSFAWLRLRVKWRLAGVVGNKGLSSEETFVLTERDDEVTEAEEEEEEAATTLAKDEGDGRTALATVFASSDFEATSNTAFKALDAADPVA